MLSWAGHTAIIFTLPDDVHRQAACKAAAAHRCSCTELHACIEHVCKEQLPSSHLCVAHTIFATLGTGPMLQEYINWRSTFFNDGLHFNPDGNQAVLKLLLEVIDSELPHLRSFLDYPLLLSCNGVTW